MFGLLFGKKNKKEVKKEEVVRPIVNADIPVGEDYVFMVNGDRFVGRCVGKLNGQVQIAVEQGVFVTNEPVTVVRKAKPEESAIIKKTVHAVDSHYVVRFLQHVYE